MRVVGVQVDRSGRRLGDQRKQASQLEEQAHGFDSHNTRLLRARHQASVAAPAPALVTTSSLPLGSALNLEDTAPSRLWTRI